MKHVNHIAHSSFRKHKNLIAAPALFTGIFIFTAAFAMSPAKRVFAEPEIPISQARVSSDKTDFTHLAQKLFELKNPYVGSPSDNGKLLLALEEYLPSSEYTVELETDKEPYVLRLAYKEIPSETETELLTKMDFTGSILLALIDNLDEFQWSYPTLDKGEEVLYTYTLQPKDVEALLRKLSPENNSPALS